MTLTNTILNAIRAWAGKPSLKAVRTYGAPGKLLSNLEADCEVAGLDIAREFGASFPDKFSASIRSGFDHNRDYDGLRLQAAQDMDAELRRTWKAGDPYSSWVDNAARRVGI